MTQNLWPNAPSGALVKIDVFGACGEYKSGKTLLGLSIAPGKHANGPFAGQARTLILDFEKSAGTYGGTGAERIDVHNELIARFPNGYSSSNVYLWFLEKIKSIQLGQYDVIMVDTISDLETGMVDYLKENIQKEVGITPGQFNSSQGLFWGKVKDKWKLVLLQLSTKCQTFFFTAHLRSRYEGSAPAKSADIRKAKEAKGKDTLLELASLYLWLDRRPDKETGKYPKVPRAWVQKDRLADTSINDDGDIVITPLLPPVIEQANVKQIRDYISKGFNYDGNSKLLKTDVETMTEEEKLCLEREIAQQKAIAAQAELAREELMHANNQRRDGIINQFSSSPEVPAVPDTIDSPAPLKPISALPLSVPVQRNTEETQLVAPRQAALPVTTLSAGLQTPESRRQEGASPVPVPAVGSAGADPVHDSEVTADEKLTDYRSELEKSVRFNLGFRLKVSQACAAYKKEGIGSLTDLEAEKIYHKIIKGIDLDSVPF